MKRFRHILPLTTIVLIAGITVFGAKPRKNWDADAALRKADYVYGQAIVNEAEENASGAFRLNDYALALNPGDPAIMRDYYFYQAYMNQDDTMAMTRLLDAAMAVFNADKSDFNNGVYVANLAKQLDRYDIMTQTWRSLDSLNTSMNEPAENLARCLLIQYILGDSTAFDEAIGIYDRLERGSGPDIGLTSQRISAMSLKKDTASILSEITRLLEAMPNDSEAHLFAGKSYMHFGNDSLTLNALTQATRLDPTNGEAFMELAEYYQNHGDSIKYQKQILGALLSHTLEAETKTELLRSYIVANIDDTERYPEIEKLFNEVVAVTPDEPSLHKLFSAFEELAGNRKEMGQQALIALSLDPTDNDTRNNLIRYYMFDEGDTLQAIELCREAMKISPENLYFPIVGSEFLIHMGKPSEALKMLEAVDITDVKNPAAVSSFLTTKGDTYYRIDSLQTALTLYDQAIALNQDNFLAYNNAAYFMAEADTLLDKAQRYARYAVLSNMESPTYLDTYAWVYFKQKNFAEAKNYIDKALNLALADSITATGEVLKFEVVAEPGETEPSFDSTEGNDNSTIDKIDYLEEEGTQPINTELNADIYEHAGDIYFMYGLPEQAVEYWEMALKLKPTPLLERKVKHKTYFYK